MLKKYTFNSSPFLFCSFCLFCLLPISSCGFRLATSVDKESCRTVNIPYVQGDSGGLLTSDLIKYIEKQSPLAFVSEGGSLTLQVKLLDEKYENTGFRYNPHDLHHGKKKIIPNETRQKDLAEITVIDNRTGQTLLGPAYILATTDYDHQNYTLNNDVNVFSIGQLNDINTSQDALDVPRFRNLAKEIASYLENHHDKLSL